MSIWFMLVVVGVVVIAVLAFRPDTETPEDRNKRLRENAERQGCVRLRDDSPAVS